MSRDALRERREARPAARGSLFAGLSVGVLLALAAGSGTAGAADSLVLGPDDESCALRGAVEVLADPDGRFEPSQALAQSGWAAPSAEPQELAPGVYWARLRLESRVTVPTPFVLVPDGHWHRVEAFDDPLSPPREVTGAALPLGRRALQSVRPLIPVLAEPHVHRSLLLRFVALPGHHFRPDRFLAGCEGMAAHFRRESRERHLHGLYGGLMLAVVFYNFFLWLSVRDRVYLRYVLYAGSFASIWLATAGVGLDLLWPDWPGWDEVSIFVFSVMALVCGNRFVQEYLQLGVRQRRLSRLLDFTSVAAIGLGLAALAGQWDLAMDPLALLAFAVVLLQFVAGGRALRSGFAPARIYLVACGALVLGVMAYVLAYLGWLHTSFATRYGAQIGSALEMVLLAFALGSRIRTLELEQREGEDRYRARLEREVEERTASRAAEKSRADAARQEAEQVNRELVEANRRLERITLVDGLTGVANRRHFNHVFEAEWRRAQRLHAPVGVVLFDVDHFKAFNDRYGHAAGDDCLRRVAATLAELARRTSDVVARYGGEEFVVILPATDLPSAQALAEQARAAIEELAIEHADATNWGRLTLSAGVACQVPEVGSSSAALLAAADAALYAAKRAGRNRVEVAATPATT